jgi:hypothetical protein
MISHYFCAFARLSEVKVVEAATASRSRFFFFFFMQECTQHDTQQLTSDTKMIGIPTTKNQ